MSTFKDANQARVHLKMRLSNYYWYNFSDVLSYTSNMGSYYIGVSVKYLNQKIKKAIPNYINGTPVKIFVD